ncbi:hypothetical protein IAR55_000220 [Kwoniella newhampshirensis]|uniref:Sugar phosphate transporter domain-containing protein n=1 Tax=Kwoniella newhampshirensis TaxID=1651941 RepID=A0AAW0Z5Z9_9TREE
MTDNNAGPSRSSLPLYSQEESSSAIRSNHDDLDEIGALPDYEHHPSQSLLPSTSKGSSERLEGVDDYDETRTAGGVDDGVNVDDTGQHQMEMERGHERHRHATVAMKKALWWRNVIITGLFILSWYIFATILALYNKWMFSPQYYGFSFPLFVTACHMVVQFALAAIIRLALAERFRPAERPTRKQYIAKILPTAASTGGDIGLSNLSLKSITLSLYTMCKSSTLIFVLLFAFTFRLEPYSLRLIAVISLISFGVFCMVFNTTAVSIPGILMVFSASALGGLRWALTELVMHKKSMGLSNPFATIFWLAPLMAVTLGVVSMILEGWFTVARSGFFNGFQAIKTVVVIVIPGGLAFAMVASEYFIIQRAGVVPMSIAGIFKEVTTISISAWVFGDQLTELNIIGVVITICGIALYSYHKYQKSMSTTLELDNHCRPVGDDDTSPLNSNPNHLYATAPSDDLETAPIVPGSSGVPMSRLDSSSTGKHVYPPIGGEVDDGDDGEDRINRMRDDFEGWDDPNRQDEDDWSEDEQEVDEEEVERRRKEREGGLGISKKIDRGRWARWWDKEM